MRKTIKLPLGKVPAAFDGGDILADEVRVAGSWARDVNGIHEERVRDYEQGFRAGWQTCIARLAQCGIVTRDLDIPPSGLPASGVRR